MEKYIVIVNQKYLVSVEAGSHGGAEHRCLDLVYGIETAQAFSRDDLSTEFFRDNAIECETISFSELMYKSNLYKSFIEYESEVREGIDRNRDEIEGLNKRIEKLRDNDDALRKKLQDSISSRASIL